MHVRSFSAALTLPLVAGAALATAPSASAAAQCTLSAPAKVTIAKPYTTYSLTAKGACVRAGWADWTLLHPYKGPVDMAWFDKSGRETFEVYDWLFAPATYTWRPEGAYDDNMNRQSQNTVKTSVRLGSWSYVGATRSGSRVTVKTQVNRYNPDTSRHTSYNKVPATIQYRTPGTSAWHNLKTVTSTSAGKASYTYTSKAKRDYRVVVKDSPSVWGSTSGAKRA